MPLPSPQSKIGTLNVSPTTSWFRRSRYTSDNPAPDWERPNRALRLIEIPLSALAFATADEAVSSSISFWRLNEELFSALSSTRS